MSEIDSYDQIRKGHLHMKTIINPLHTYDKFIPISGQNRLFFFNRKSYGFLTRIHSNIWLSSILFYKIHEPAIRMGNRAEFQKTLPPPPKLLFFPQNQPSPDDYFPIPLNHSNVYISICSVKKGSVVIYF